MQFGILVDRLADGPVDRLKLGGEMIDCRGGQLGRGGVAETAADAILPLRPAPAIGERGEVRQSRPPDEDCSTASCGA